MLVLLLLFKIFQHLPFIIIDHSLLYYEDCFQCACVWVPVFSFCGKTINSHTTIFANRMFTTTPYCIRSYKKRYHSGAIGQSTCILHCHSTTTVSHHGCHSTTTVSQHGCNSTWAIIPDVHLHLVSMNRFMNTSVLHQLRSLGDDIVTLKSRLKYMSRSLILHIKASGASQDAWLT